MSENVQSKPSIGSTIVNTLIDEGTLVAKGAVIGSATGAVVGAAAPVSKKQIAYQIADKFVKSDTAVKEQYEILKKVLYNENILDSINKTKNNVLDDKFIQAEIKELLGDNVQKNADAMAESLKNLLDDSVKDLKSADVKTKIEQLCDSLGDKASGMVKDFFAKSRAERKIEDEANTLVKLAKKCAKKAQLEKFVGIAAAAGVFTLLFSYLFKGFGPSKGGQKEGAPQTNAAYNKLNTHQG